MVFSPSAWREWDTSSLRIEYGPVKQLLWLQMGPGWFVSGRGCMVEYGEGVYGTWEHRGERWEGDFEERHA